MQQMQHATTRDVSADACAAQLIEVVPLVMRTIRAYMRAQRSAQLTVPQFRTLGHVHRHPGVSLSGVAEHLGLSLGATSRLVDALVGQGLIERLPSQEDRRFVTLRLTGIGEETLAAMQQGATRMLAQLLRETSEADRSTLLAALGFLRATFAGAGPEPPGDHEPPDMTERTP
jgi:DNA-binding MarR family transcriptional regulator